MERSKEDLERELNISKEKMLSKFCPIINNGCREDCACFEPGVISRIPNYKDIIVDHLQTAWCKHPFIDGFLIISDE